MARQATATATPTAGTQPSGTATTNGSGSSDSYRATLDRLSKASVEKHWEPYIDIPWDDPDFAIDPDDPRWKLPPVDQLGGHPWYQAQPPGVQSRIGLWRVATAMKVGMQFENLLKRGLLSYAYRLDNHDPEFRYVYHETIEEGHHGMMFQEFVNRTGMPIEGMPRSLRRLALVSPLIPALDPDLFFIFVLGGEDPIDFVQRQTLRSGTELHPLEEKIIRIHVAEESRHLSFARTYLRRRAPGMSLPHRRALAIAIPIILGRMSRTMLDPPKAMIKHFGIPQQVVKEAYRENPAGREAVVGSLTKVRDLAAELGLITAPSRLLWKAMGIWAEPNVLRGGRKAEAANSPVGKAA
jgi:P-aminobenzoate N-oxygenase AurF